MKHSIEYYDLKRAADAIDVKEVTFTEADIDAALEVCRAATDVSRAEYLDRLCELLSEIINREPVNG